MLHTPYPMTFCLNLKFCESLPLPELHHLATLQILYVHHNLNFTFEILFVAMLHIESISSLNIYHHWLHKLCHNGHL